MAAQDHQPGIIAVHQTSTLGWICCTCIVLDFFKFYLVLSVRLCLQSIPTSVKEHLTMESFWIQIRGPMNFHIQPEQKPSLAIFSNQPEFIPKFEPYRTYRAYPVNPISVYILQAIFGTLNIAAQNCSSNLLQKKSEVWLLTWGLFGLSWPSS